LASRRVIALEDEEPAKGESGMPSNGFCVVGLTGVGRSVGGFHTWEDHTVRIRLPKRFSADDLALIQRDADQLADVVREHPTQMLELLEAAMRRDLPRARQIGRELGLSESDFQQKGGGVIWWVVVVVVVAVIVITEGSADGDEGSEPGDYPTNGGDSNA
jgi:hypothetical protein